MFKPVKKRGKIGRFFFRTKYKFTKWLWRNEHPKLTQEDWDKILQLDWHRTDDPAYEGIKEACSTFSGCDK